MPARARSSAQRLCDEVSEGGVTLVLGAGVSLSRGVPSWSGLVHELWPRVMGKPFHAMAAHPFELQFAFELMRERLAGEPRLRARLAKPGKPAQRARKHGVPGADESLAELIREGVYGKLRPAPASDTLATIARLLRAEFGRPQRRVLRVITFNADDLLEREVHGSAGWKRAPVLWPIARESQHPRRGLPAPIPVYHVHGFLPSGPGRYPDAPDTLVFTDLQFWSAVSHPNSFANRTVAQALHDSRCLFVGLSMTDVNLIRWLGLRAVAIHADRRSQLGQSGDVRAAVQRALRRHFWVRTAEADPTGIASALLECRGVRSVVIDGWESRSFARLMKRAFV